jgi:hypothetical protein
LDKGKTDGSAEEICSSSDVQAQREAVPKIAVRRYGELAEQIHEAICGLEK